MLRLLFLYALALSAATPEVDIRLVLDDQAAAWNRGDIDGFMKTYEASPDTVFAGASGITKGHDKVLARYKTKYPTKAIMGALHFTDVTVRMLTPDLASVTGQYHLQRSKEAGGDASGWFTLVMKKTPQGWKIIHDHTS
ncbi:MAG: nuclear transport factor 2 family protein [Acidobacteria bacterium]|nr:nuclear transport factor 2 family protein [Acidobacteriota bacterium]